MDFEDYILIIIKKTGLSRKEILEMIETKKNESEGAFTDLLALFIITKDFCVDI